LYFNLWIVFLLSGLWHGASWNFVIWGAYHGMFLILDRLFLIRVLERIGKIPSILITFLIVMIGWVIFRLEDFDSIGIYLQKLFAFHGTFEMESIPTFGFFAIVAAFFSFLCLTPFGRKMEEYFFFPRSYRIK